MHCVLVVCDDEEDLSFLTTAFHTQSMKFPVTCFTAGQKLLDFNPCYTTDDCPFLIIIDQYLPDIDSLTLLTKLKSADHSRLIPVAIMSGFASEDLIREYYFAGANCFYKKPIDPPDWSHMADCLITLFYNKF